MISAVLPCYNARLYLAAAIGSLRAQTVAVAEIIVVDDASTDGSRELAESIPGVRVLSQPNAGASAARNLGVAHATHPLVVFLDSDDLLPPTSLADRLALLTPEVAVVSGLIDHFISPDVPVDQQRSIAVPPRMHARIPSTLLVRRSAFEAIGGFDPSVRMGEAMDWFARLEAGGYATAATETVVLHRRLHRSNTTRDRVGLEREYLSVLRSVVARRRQATEG